MMKYFSIAVFYVSLWYLCDANHANVHQKMDKSYDVNECDNPKIYEHSCPTAKGTCINTMGSWHCKCNRGFENPFAKEKVCVDESLIPHDTSVYGLELTFPSDLRRTREVPADDQEQILAEEDTIAVIKGTTPFFANFIKTEPVTVVTQGGSIITNTPLFFIDVDDEAALAELIKEKAKAIIEYLWFDVKLVKVKKGSGVTQECTTSNDCITRAGECVDSTCTCPEHYVQNGTTCVPDGKIGSPCLNNWECTTRRTHCVDGQCECWNDYFEAFEDECIKYIDECADNAIDTTCGGQGTCENIPGSWECVCNDGYEHLPGNPHTCVDTDECNEESCDGEGACVNSEGSWSCDCNDGYGDVSGNDQACIDFDECNDPGVDASCGGGGNCVNSAGSWDCVCSSGYRHPEGNTQTCDDIEECDENAEGTDCDNVGTCANAPGTWTCDCDEGYGHPSGNTQACEDIDECNNPPAGVDNSCGVSGAGHCQNSIGSWSCNCNDGYIHPIGNGQTCNDINECDDSSLTPTCESTAGTCANNDGSWVCQCNAGYVQLHGNTQACDYDDCGAGSTCANGRCENIQGSWLCGCDAGYHIDPANIQSCIAD